MSDLTSGDSTGLTVRRRSVSMKRAGDVEKGQELGILVDVSACTGCKACEVACITWHDLHPPIAEAEDLRRAGFSFQSAPDLAPDLLTLMTYQETETERGWTWFMTKRQCMHCHEPGCLNVCPAPGAIVQYANGVVDFDHSKCIRCRMCRSGCPFDIPRYNANGNPVKCNFCLDRVANGLTPACVKACPTNALHFGLRSEMVERGHQIVARLRERGFSNARLYASEGVGGAGYTYVLPHGEQVNRYGKLPENPTVSPRLSLWGGPLGWLLAELVG